MDGELMGDGDDVDDDSSRDDARDEDEDEEDEEDEEEEHLAPADPTTVIPTDEPVFPPVERLLAMTTPSPSPPISLSPPSAGERLARCTAPPAHSPPLPPSSGCLTQTQTLRIASTRLVLIVTAHMRSERVHARPTRGQGIDYGFVSTLMLKRGDRGLEMSGTGLGILGMAGLVYHIESSDSFSGRFTYGERMTLPGDPYGWWRRRPYAYPERLGHSIGIESRNSQELQTHRDLCMHMRDHLQGPPDTATNDEDQMVEDSRGIRDMRREMGDIQVTLLALREQREDSRQSDLEARIPENTRSFWGRQTVTSCDLGFVILLGLLYRHGAEGVVGLTRWIEKMESVFHISGCAVENIGKLPPASCYGDALDLANGQIRNLRSRGYAMTRESTQKKMTKSMSAGESRS
ncbi:hypothetical protein Tco_0656214 [Tanacetum coccineum]|uniref:Uncharacterized protein n=1 Tax=Tanacetum coccineum TaxID=301880 RepID=A0ABQ4X8S9_9ASTR